MNEVAYAMTLAKGPRPHSIKLFACGFIAAAVVAYVQALQFSPPIHELLAFQMPWFEWTQGRAIVFLSAKLSIAFIPVVMIYAGAIRFARWLVTIVCVWELLSLPQKASIWVSDPYVSVGYLAEPLLTLLALIMLFTPSANRYFAQKEPVDASTFE